jgi:hypothetical protein
MVIILLVLTLRFFGATPKPALRLIQLLLTKKELFGAAKVCLLFTPTTFEAAFFVKLP